MKAVKRALVVTVGLASASLAMAGGDRPAPPSFADIDANDDQLISQEELQSFMQSRRSEGGRRGGPRGGRFNPFDIADADGDGYLNVEEFDAMREKMRERMGKRRKGDYDPPEEDL